MFRPLIQRTARAVASKMTPSSAPKQVPFSAPRFSHASFNNRQRKTAFYATTAAAGAAVCPIDHKTFALQADTNYVAKAKSVEADLRKAIEKLLEDDDYDGYGHYGPVFLRLAWHSSGTFDQRHKNGGSNGGCIRMQPEAGHGANNGLEVARNRLETIKKQFPYISYADIYILAGVVASDNMIGAETDAERVKFRFGRSDFQPKVFEVDTVRLPDASQGSDHVRQVFTTQMGFTDQEIVALLGAHAVGKMHLDRSGYSSSKEKGTALPWTYAPTTLGNHYYKTLLEEDWSPVKNPHNNNEVQYENKARDLIMLPAEIILLSDSKFRPYVDKYAKDEDAWKKDYNKALAKLFELGVKFP